jgi:putative Mg2+ transporter-C (MgtC) family protein
VSNGGVCAGFTRPNTPTSSANYVTPILVKVVMEFISIDWGVVVSDFIRILLAFVLAVPIAWERVRSPRNLGLRTFPIVATASAGFVLVARSLPEIGPEGLARVIQGLIAGIGFIGGGAILKEGLDVHGLATAASVWNTGAIGAAVALDRYEIAVVLTLLNFLTLYFLTPVANNFKEDSLMEKGENGGGHETIRTA